jgi:SAM-dependent methyltransferase
MPTALVHDPAREERELRAYLGDSYDEARLHDYDGQLEAEFAEVRDEAEFYRRSRAYLYNLTAFAMTPTKRPYLETVARLVDPGDRVLEYGCGIGSDGLELLEAGYRVEFADYDNPSVEYLRWRLAHRGLEAPIHDLDRGVPGGFDLAFAFDVIEHTERPAEFLREMESRARIVVVNLLEPIEGETELHHDLPVGRLVLRAARRRLLAHEVHHGRSHLLAYESRLAPPPSMAVQSLREGARLARRRLARTRRR